MANYVQNHIHFDCGDKTMREILAAIQKDDDGVNQRFGIGTIDFNKIEPMPPELLKNGGWYDWSLEHWGTKWNSIDDEYDGDRTISFMTAWTPPEPILKELSDRFTGVYITHRWAEEELGVNVGQREYLNGECVGLVEPETAALRLETACDIWGGEPIDFGYLHNQSGGYCPVENEEYEVIELLDRRMLFADYRLEPDEIPVGLYAYALRMTDDGSGFGALEPSVSVNFGGTVLTDQPVDFGDTGYIELTEDTDPNFLGYTRTMGQYLREEWDEEETADETATEGMKLE